MGKHIYMFIYMYVRQYCVSCHLNVVYIYNIHVCMLSYISNI